ncbi:phospho-sugar mutase [soil metagenome]
MDHHDDALAWLAEDPDPDTRDELQRLLDIDDAAGIADRFADRLEFGTAGMRGALGAGPNRMNRALVRRVTAGLADRVVQGPDEDTRTVVVGCDARHNSDVFAADTAMVLAGAGVAVHQFPDVVVTPLVAYAVRHLATDAGVMVTASHNPPADNGYKVYGPGGRQIIPPLDEEISEAIDAVGSLAGVPLAPADSDLITPVPPEVQAAYTERVLAMVDADGPRDLRIVYTALHGVAGAICVSVLEQAGFADVHPVPEQHQPDPDFPTVAFPNPEEPGAMDLATALAVAVDADLVLANDPDGDRIAVGVPDGDGWRLLSGDEIGVVLAEDVLARGALTAGRRPWVGTTVVSSTLLSKVAAHHGAGYAETLTGFKWLSKVAEDLEQVPGDAAGTMVLAYEQALGVSIGDLVRDKDGISAALTVADLAARLKAQGRSLTDLLDDLAQRHGAHVTLGRSVLLNDPGADGVDLVQRALDGLRATPPADLGGSPVTAVWDHDAGILTRTDGSVEAIDLPATPLLRYLAQDGTMVMVRPSGTEPKLKFYGEAIVTGDDPAAARAAATARVEAVLTGFMAAALA